jgi:hypothetical protein
MADTMNLEEITQLALTTVHPQTGEALVDGELSVKSNDELVQFLPPSSPSKFEDTYGDDGEVDGQRELSDQEFAAATKAFEDAEREWKLLGGRAYAKGPQSIEGRFTTAKGASLNGLFDGKKWHWTAWSTES